MNSVRGPVSKKKKKEGKQNSNNLNPNAYLVCIWVRMKNKNHFTIQLIFFIIHGSYYTF